MRQLEQALNVTDETKFERACELYNEITVDLTDFCNRHIKLGFDLIKFEKERLYSVIKPANANAFSIVYPNIYVFCEAEFGVKKRACADHIAVAKKYADKDGKLRAGYEDYSFSQLVVMLQTKNFNPAVVERFTPGVKVADMKALVKAVKRGTFDLQESNAWNINRINELIEAEKAAKADDVKANIEAAEEQYVEKDKITADGELIEGAAKVRKTALLDEKQAWKNIRKMFHEHNYSVMAGGKPITDETVIGNIIKAIYKELEETKK